MAFESRRRKEKLSNFLFFINNPIVIIQKSNEKSYWTLMVLRVRSEREMVSRDENVSIYQEIVADN